MDPIQGQILYDFREAINALSRASQDSAMLASRWYDLCDTTREIDVNINLSSGQTMTVPNLGKAIAALKKRSGEIDATSVKVNNASQGVSVLPQGFDAGASGAKYADGKSRSQHAYATPYNTYRDACYVSNSPSCHDSYAFLAVPGVIFFNPESTLDANGYHAIAIKPLVSTALIKDRPDKNGICLSAAFKVVNADNARTCNIVFATNTAEDNNVLSVALAPGQYAEFLIWCWNDADAANITRLH